MNKRNYKLMWFRFRVSKISMRISRARALESSDMGSHSVLFLLFFNHPATHTLCLGSLVTM